MSVLVTYNISISKVVYFSSQESSHGESHLSAIQIRCVSLEPGKISHAQIFSSQIPGDMKQRTDVQAPLDFQIKCTICTKPECFVTLDGGKCFDTRHFLEVK